MEDSDGTWNSSHVGQQATRHSLSPTPLHANTEVTPKPPQRRYWPQTQHSPALPTPRPYSHRPISKHILTYSFFPAPAALSDTRFYLRTSTVAMSWSGFKKAASRAGTQVMMKTGHVEKTADREYGVEERRYRTLESAATRLQKEAKGYLDSLRAMTASQMRIAETIDAFYGDSGAKDGVSRSYKQAVEDLDAETVKALDGPYRCVPQDLYRYAWDEETGIVDQRVIDEVEKELNFKAKTRRTFTMGDEEFERAIRLMDYVYRTTVLEPISRFCAYFPDINECEW